MDSNANEKDLFLSKASVKRIMKLNEAVSNVSNDAALATAKATELWLAKLMTRAGKNALAHKRKTVKVDDIIECVEKHLKDYPFLVDAFGPLEDSENKTKDDGPVKIKDKEPTLP